MDEKLNSLLLAIKSDNLVLFSEHIKGYEDVSLGRFPVLSIMYLYNAKKIARTFEEKLGRIKSYKVTSEPIELTCELRKLAGKKLRVCVNTNEVITPLQMLALLGKDKKLKKLYKTFYVNDDIKKKIISVYKVSAQKVYFDSFGVHIERRAWGYKERRKVVTTAIVSIACAVVLALIYSVSGMVSGFGVGNSPYKIASARQLLIALNKGDKYELCDDITLDNMDDDIEFYGTLDGRGHTIYIDNLDGFGIDKNAGTIKNLNIVYRVKNETITKQIGLVANKNEGNISNINVTIESTKITANRSAENDCGVYGVAVVNSGTISDIKIKMDIELTAVGDGECSVSGVVYSNSGRIENCLICEGSRVKSSECDLAGIAIYNEVGGAIYNAKNYATLSQQSSTKTWSPNVAGVVLSNLGTVSHSINYGALSVQSTYSESDGGIVYVGGISANNYSLIDKCLNYGDINISTNKIMIYTGGIVASGIYASVDSDTTLVSTVKNSGADCNINVQTEDDKAFAFVGGICGYMYGEIDSCFSLVTFTQGATETKYFVGSAVGATYVVESYLWSKVIYLTAKNIYVVDRENVDAHIGAFISSGSIVSINQNYNVSSIENGITTLGTEELLKAEEVYFDDKNI